MKLFEDMKKFFNIISILLILLLLGFWIVIYYFNFDINLNSQLVLIDLDKFVKLLISNEMISSLGINYHRLINRFVINFSGGIDIKDIQNLILIFIFIRFLILSIRYNLKTSAIITIIGVLASILWYKHFVDTLMVYSGSRLFLNISFIESLSTQGLEFLSRNSDFYGIDNVEYYDKLGSDVHWYEPGKLLYYSFMKGIINVVNSGSGTDNSSMPEKIGYYMDPVSMFISILPSDKQTQILPTYYNIYNDVIPETYEILSLFFVNIFGVASYSIITRIGRRYCPYLIRWHWSTLILVEFIEEPFISLALRLTYFQNSVISQSIKALQYQLKPNVYDPQKSVISVTELKNMVQSLIMQENLINALFIFGVITHLILILLALFHALCGQYFYVPFLTECVELNIGLRPKHAIYSGGKTAWQDEKRSDQMVNKIWYGWFGRGKIETSIFDKLKLFLVINIKKLIRLFKK